MPGIALPPFPDNIPIHPLVVVDYKLIQRGDEEEIAKLWEAATELGFWYLKNHGADDEVDGMFQMGDETMDLPLKVKMEYTSGPDGRSFGYKAAGANVVDEKGTPDTAEFLNISKDDVLSYPLPTYRTYPPTVNAHMEPIIKPFVSKSIDVTSTILSVFEQKLGLPTGSLLKRHALRDFSGSGARCIKNPAKPRPSSSVSTDGTLHASADIPDKLALGAHTDFGSLSFLHNRLGGLQVLPPGFTTWQYVRPLPGHAICNVGDALTLFSGGILRSNMHRVIPPPGEQAYFPRWSVVYFLRPGNDIVLRSLADESSLIAETMNCMSDEEKKRFEPGETAGEWFARRVRGRKIVNMKGPETYRASAGMEHSKSAFESGLGEVSA